MHSKKTRSAKVLLALGMLAAVVAADQAVLWFALDDGYWMGRRIAPFDPPLFSAEQEHAAELIASCVATGEPAAASFRFDPELGWTAPRDRRHGDDVYDANGARVGRAPIAQERTPGVRRIVAIGCSFTEGDEVAAHESWAARSELADPALEVANLGVGAYGLDQALLRWRRDGRALAADAVWLGWLPSASPRLITLYRPAQRHWGQLVAFKPRFVWNEDALELIPCPAGDVRTVHALLSDASAFLAATGEHDAWVAACRAAYAPSGSRLLHYSAVARIALTFAERRGRDVAARLRDADDEMTRLVEGVVRAAHDEITASGSQFRLLVLPGRDDLRAAQEPAGAPWAGVVERLEAHGVDVVDLTPTLLDAGGADEESLWMPGGHYSPRTNARIADVLAEH